MSDLILSTCRGTSCPECGRAAPSWGGLLPSLCGCRVCCSGCFSAHERKLLTEAIRQRDTFAEAQKRDLNEAIEVIHDLQVKLDKAREELADQQRCTFDANGHADAAIKDVEALREERDAAANLLAVIHRDGARAIAAIREKAEALRARDVQHFLRVEAEEQVAKQAEEIAGLTRERDEARAEAKKWCDECDAARAAAAGRGAAAGVP